MGVDRPRRRPAARLRGLTGLAAHRYARVAVEVAPAHLDRPFDYLVPDGLDVGVGQRVRVDFSGRRRLAWVLAVVDEPAAEAERVRPLRDVDGPVRWFDAVDLRVARWVADRYAGTLASVLRHAVPDRVAHVDREVERWGEPQPHPAAQRPPCPSTAWRPYAASELLRALAARPPGTSGVVESLARNATESTTPPAGAESGAWWLRVLSGDEPAALGADLVSRCLAAGRTAVVLTADPASPLARSALAVAGPLGADLRGLESPGRSTARARYQAALRCRTGHARVAVGGRAAVLAPVTDLGLVLVEDEANPAYKERRSPRHHAREVALARARLRGAVCVLTGDLPSAALWRLLEAGHVAEVAADRAEERRRAPRVDVVDLDDPRPGARRARLSSAAARALSESVRGGGAAVVLASRRGEGTALACRSCGTRRACAVCDGAIGPVPPGPSTEGSEPEGPGPWRCATCGWHGDASACPVCGGTDHAPLAAGAARLATELARSHPSAAVVLMEGFDADGPTGRPAIAVMTRGSVVTAPAWLRGAVADVAVVPEVDALLGRARFDAGEDALRLLLAAGRWSRRLVVQTREPGNPAVQGLVRWDPVGWWRGEAERRAELDWPPSASLVALAPETGAAVEVAAAVRAALPADEVLGPDLDGLVTVKSRDLRGTLAALTPLRHGWGLRGVRVRVDVDPL